MGFIDAFAVSIAQPEQYTGGPSRQALGDEGRWRSITRLPDRGSPVPRGRAESSGRRLSDHAPLIMDYEL